jgi:ABC-type cobalt transport system, ATPase component
VILRFDSVSLENRIENISFSLNPGETLVLSGPSGAGKSTMLSLAAGLCEPSSGTVSREGEFAYLFQESDLQIFENTVALEVGFALRCRNVDKESIKESVKAALECVGLDWKLYGNRTPYTLSGGEKKRIALASLIVMEPEILFLDEPTVGLDGKSAKGFAKVLKSLKARGIGILLATHDANLISECADRVLTLEKGRKTGELGPGEYFASHPEVSPIALLAKNLDLDGVFRFDDFIERLGGLLC